MIAIVKEIDNNNNNNNNNGQGGQAPSPLSSPLSNQKRFNNFSFKHQGYCFLRVFRNFMNQNFTNFIKFATIFGQFSAASSFFLTK